jgi:hypothetical protein
MMARFGWRGVTWIVAVCVPSASAMTGPSTWKARSKFVCTSRLYCRSTKVRSTVLRASRGVKS